MRPNAPACQFDELIKAMHVFNEGLRKEYGDTHIFSDQETQAFLQDADAKARALEGICAVISDHLRMLRLDHLEKDS
jgi:hypothetical protein